VAIQLFDCLVTEPCALRTVVAVFLSLCRSGLPCSWESHSIISPLWKHHQTNSAPSRGIFPSKDGAVPTVKGH
jgi:hypothetical protein